MNTLNKEYFFVLQPDDERIPFLAADKDTTTKQYDWEIMPIGMKPLIFHNGIIDIQEEKKINPVNPPPEILFNGSNLVVIERIADKLADLEIPDLAIQPAIYIDHKDDWYENYWFLTFTTRFDCWDRKNSEHGSKPVGAKPSSHKVHTYTIDNLQPMYSVYTYSLDESVLQETPLKDRRLFKMGGTMDGFVVAHKSIVDLFRVKWVDIVPIEDYGVNYP